MAAGCRFSRSWACSRCSRMLLVAVRLSYPGKQGRGVMASSPATICAVRAPGLLGNLCLTTLPPERDGWVRDRVEAFGLNRPELKLRLGLSEGVSFPRVPGAAGTVGAAPAGSSNPWDTRRTRLRAGIPR
jgi:hypothetical protein